MRTIIIERCSNCPFYDHEWDSCAYEGVQAKLVTHLNYLDGPVPEDCPLRGGGIAIKINELSDEVWKKVHNS